MEYANNLISNFINGCFFELSILALNFNIQTKPLTYLKNCSAFIIAIAITNSIYAQQPEQLLNQWAEKAPIEKVYLHFDRDHYIAGETAWFKAYLYSDYLPDTISSVLYIELANESSIIISSKILPVILSSTNGQFELPDSLTTGNYTLSAFAPSMLNNGSDFIFKKNIFIYGKKSTAEFQKNEIKKTNIEFFPESGNLINGFNNVVAFKITNDKGLPESGTGVIFDANDKKITTFSTYHDGMGIFEINPQEHKNYFARMDYDNSSKYELPIATSEGIVFMVIPHPQGYLFELYQKQKDPTRQPAYMIGQMQHHVVFRQDLMKDKEGQTGIINTQKIKSGILQITVFNKDGIPLAERLCFVDNKEYQQDASLRMDTINFKEKGSNHFKIVMNDTVQGSLSVAITDAGFDLKEQREETIISNLLLTSDLKGYIHNPAWYFNAINDSVQTAMDLLMMTHGWRRIKWNELKKKINEPLKYKDPVYITINGRINLQGTKKPFAEKQLMAIITAEGLGKSMQLVNSDKEGNFKLDSLLFFGRGRILFIDIRGKKSQYIDVVMSGDSINKHFEIVRNGVVNSGGDGIIVESKMQADYEAIQKASGILLEEVTIKAIKKTPVQLLEERYSSGMFSGNAEKTIDLVNTNDYIIVDNIFDHLVRIVPGLDFVSDGGAFTIYYRQGPSASSMGPIPMIVYLNEVETDASVIATIPPQEIAMVKVFNYFVGAAGNGAGGALAIYTRKEKDIVNSSRGDFINYNGFSVIKEFYTPDYKADPSLFFKSDNRITLLWRPNIFVNNINPVIPLSFYNSDRAQKFKVVVQGMTTSGKLINLEKIITTQK